MDLLSKLQMTEVSGVDDPANEIPGWMVAKAKANGAADFGGFYVVAPDGDVSRAAGFEIKPGDERADALEAMRLLGADIETIESLAGTATTTKAATEQPAAETAGLFKPAAQTSVVASSKLPWLPVRGKAGRA